MGCTAGLLHVGVIGENEGDHLGREDKELTATDYWYRKQRLESERECVLRGHTLERGTSAVTKKKKQRRARNEMKRKN